MVIDQQAIQEIKRSITPAQVIEFYTGQQAKHNKYLCPFHNDRHPSLSVKGGHWRCWSCGEHGDVISFAQKYFRIGFQEAVVKIADDFNLDIGMRRPPIKNPLEKLCEAIRLESIENNRQEVAYYIEELEEEIDKLTTAHRVLARLGTDEQILRQYADEIDSLIEEKDYVRRM